jgi:uncharacterized membrane protein
MNVQRRPNDMRPEYHNSHNHKHERIDGRTSWKVKKRLITITVRIIGAALLGSGLYLLFSGGETFAKIIGGVIFLAGAFLIGFSRELRDWIFTKW